MAGVAGGLAGPLTAWFSSMDAAESFQARDYGAGVGNSIMAAGGVITTVGAVETLTVAAVPKGLPTMAVGGPGHGHRRAGEVFCG